MTALATSIVAIVLFGMMLVATVNYGDALGYMSTTDSALVVDRLQSGVAIVAQIQHDTGSRPTTVAELTAAGVPEPFVHDGSEFAMSCSDERCSPMSLCLSLPANDENIAVARSAAARIKGVVSGSCGSTGDAVVDRVVVGVSI